MRFNLLASASTVAMGSLVALSVPQVAQAGLTCTATTCTETITGTTTKTDFAGSPVTLDMFNPSGTETLQSVILSEGANFTAVGNLTNSSPSQQSFSFQAGLGLKLAAGSGAPSNFPLLSSSGSIVPQTYVLAGGASTPYNFNDTFSSNNVTITGAGNVAGFIGPGTFQALFTAKATTSFSGGGNNITTNLTTTATPDVIITYNFTGSPATPTAPSPTPTPEPASLAILGSGLVGTGIMRRRRNKN